MNIPLFFLEKSAAINDQLTLDEETSKHIVQVLRMKPGNLVKLTDGKGTRFTAEIINDHKKKCEVKIVSALNENSPSQKIGIAISLLKNASRLEWFLEKATELGINEIIPILCERTERQHFRTERMRNICVSAMLQSQQSWMPELRDPIAYTVLLENIQYDQRLIAHCGEGEKTAIAELAVTSSCILFIGPEGDFTTSEINEAKQHLFIPVSLGSTRLRTETAGVVGAAILAMSRR